MVFWISWGIDAVTALVFVYFFFAGLADGTVSSFNILLWLLILGIAALVVGGSLALRSRGRIAPAMILVVVPAVWCALIGVFMLVISLFWPSH